MNCDKNLKPKASGQKSSRFIWVVILMSLMLSPSLSAEVSALPIRSEGEFSLRPLSDKSQRYPDIAYGNGVFLVVWQDGWNGVGGDSNILAYLVKPEKGAEGLSSEVVAEKKKLIVISKAKGHQEVPQVSFCNGVFLVVWHDFRNGLDADVYGRRVSTEGKLLDKEAFPIAKRPHNQNFPMMTHSDKNFLVVWQEVRYGQTYDLVGSLVSSTNSEVSHPKGHLIAKDCGSPALAFTGKHFVIGWLNHGRKKYLRYCRYKPEDLKRVEYEPIRVGHPDAFRHEGQMKMISGVGEVAVIWAKGIKTDPWGWGGPGGILSLRIKDDGTTPDGRAFNKIRWSPEGRSQYTARILPGVLDTARWKGFEGQWPQGRPGGFKEATNGHWPHAYLSGTAIPEAPGQYFSVWVRAHLEGHKKTGRYDIVGGRLGGKTKWAAPDFPPILLSAEKGCSLLPAICASEKGGPFLLAYEERKENDRVQVTVSFVYANPIEEKVEESKP